MSLTGLFLVLFLLFHGSMNVVAVFSQYGYDQIVHFLGTNAIVQFMVPVLALFFIIHIVYSILLTLQNRKARGTDRYAVVGKSPVEWTAKNMFVLGLVVFIGLCLHLYHFWAKMQLMEWTGREAQDGYGLIVQLFSDPVYVIIYLAWFVAIWLHLTHGVWSAFQTIGLSNNTWYPRLKVIGNILATVICLMFAFVALAFYAHSLGWFDNIGQLWQLGAH